MKRSLLIAGGTGLIGSAVVELAAKDTRFARVITWGRRSTPNAPALVEHWGPGPNGLLEGLRGEPVDAVICCLGTTMRNVKGDKAAFVHVDKELVLGLGRWASDAKARFCLVSSLGADSTSRIFYNRVKGEVETELQRMPYQALHIFRPSVLDGPRSENRPGERVGLAVMKFFAPLLPAASRPMPYSTLAAALVNTAAKEDTGTQIHTYRSIVELAR